MRSIWALGIAAVLVMLPFQGLTQGVAGKFPVACIFTSGQVYVNEKLIGSDYVDTVEIHRAGKTYPVIAGGKTKSVYLSDLVGTNAELNEKNYNFENYPPVTIEIKLKNTEGLIAYKKRIETETKKDVKFSGEVGYYFYGSAWGFSDKSEGVKGFAVPFNALVTEKKYTAELPKEGLWKLKENRKNIDIKSAAVRFTLFIHKSEQGKQKKKNFFNGGFNGFDSRERPS